MECMEWYRDINQYVISTTMTTNGIILLQDQSRQTCISELEIDNAHFTWL